MNKHLRRLIGGLLPMLAILGLTALMVGLVVLAVAVPWTGIISGGLFLLTMAYMLGSAND